MGIYSWLKQKLYAWFIQKLYDKFRSYYFSYFNIGTLESDDHLNRSSIEELIIPRESTYSESFYNTRILAPISDDAIEALLRGLKQSKKLRKIQLNCVELSDVGWAHVVDLIQNNNVIQEVILNETVITPGIAAQLTAALRGRFINVLDLDKCLIGDAGATVIADFLADGARVETVILTNNNIQEDGLKAIANALKSIQTKRLDLSGNSQLKRLYEVQRFINENTIYDENNRILCNESGIEAIFTALEENTTLEEISLAQMGVEKILVMAATAVAKNRTLRTLDLSFNCPSWTTMAPGYVNQNRITQFAVALTTNRTLETLNVAGNGLVTADLIILSQHIGEFALKDLNLGKNNMHSENRPHDPGLLALAAGLRSNRSFISLNLSDMNIEHTMEPHNQNAHGWFIQPYIAPGGNGNFLPLRDSLLHLPKLKHLNLNGNDILSSVVGEMVIHTQCNLESLQFESYHYHNVGNYHSYNIQDLIQYLAQPARHQKVRLMLLKGNLSGLSQERANEAIKPINEYRRDMLRSYYAFMMVGNKTRFGKEHPKEENERVLQRLPELPTDVGRKIFEYAGYRRPLRLI